MLAACMARAGGMGALVDPDPGRAARAAARMSSSAARAGFPGKAVQCVLDFLFKHREMVSRLVELGVAQEAAPVGSYFDGTDAGDLLYLLLSGAAGVPGRGL